MASYIAAIIIIIAIWCIANYPTLKKNWEEYKNGGKQTESQADSNCILEDASRVEGEAYWVVNNNKPYFTEEEKQKFIKYVESHKELQKPDVIKLYDSIK